MKAIWLVLLCIGFLYASDPDAGPSTAPGAPAPGRADITITQVNTYTVTLGGNPRGCDFADTAGYLLVTDYTSDLIYALNPDNGTVMTSIPCPAGVPDVLGVVYEQTPGGNAIYINNWNTVTDIHKYNGTSWSTVTNPVTGEPRGMDQDEDGMIWCSEAASRKLYRFNTSGGDVTSWTLADLPASYSCACAVFPYNGNVGILVGGYTYGSFYFFECVGAGLVYLGSAPEPASVTSSYDVCYSADRDTFFWVSKTGSAFSITEFEVEFDVALTRDTWAGIKASF
jgi:hypothetical protein